MNLYQQKYLKYKNKYELLKKQIGGDCPPVAARRIVKDLQNLYRFPRWGISAVLDELNVCKVNGTIAGPRGTPYEGYLWRVVMNFPSEFPFKAPTVNFVDRIFHPNIHYDSGSVCISILKNEPVQLGDPLLQSWNPSLDIGSILQSIQSMLGDANEFSPYNVDAAKVLRESRAANNPKIYDDAVIANIRRNNIETYRGD
jgi:ubiquitin-protein ligase